MFRLLLSSLLVLSGLTFAGGSVEARDGFTRAAGFRGVPLHGKRFFSPRRLRPSVPLFLDQGWSNGPIVVVNQTFVPPASAPSTFAVPTLADLPVSLGIREAPPAQAAIYVLNENGAVRREAAVGRARVASGPKILEVQPEAVASTAAIEGARAEERSFGARIIHLSVPVARAD